MFVRDVGNERLCFFRFVFMLVVQRSLASITLVLLAAGGIASPLRAQPFERQVAPFPVHDSTGRAYEFPFLGGLSRPRPQLVDIDDDGDDDLFVQERANRITFFEKTDGRFVWQTDKYRGLDVGQWFRFGDLDADGDADLLGEQPVGRVRYYRNEGTPAAPSFALAADTLRAADGTPIFAARQNVPALAALDCSAPPDLVLGRLDGRLGFYEHDGLRNGVPQFRFVSNSYEDVCVGPPRVCNPGSSVEGQQVGGSKVEKSKVGRIEARTINSNPQTHNAKTHNPQTPNPQTRKRENAQRLKHGANVVTGADADRDGDPDLLWGDFNNTGIVFIENEGACGERGLRIPPDSLFPRSDPLQTAGHNAPTWGDAAGDDDPDLLAGVLLGEGVENTVYLENTGGGFALQTRRFLYNLDLGGESTVAAGDLYGSTRPDLVLGSSGAQLVALRNPPVQDAPAALRQSEPLLPAAAFRFNVSPALGDLTGDARSDLLVGAFGGEIAFYRRTGDGGFALVNEALAELPRGNYAAPALGDLDGDGDRDLLAGESAGNLNFFRNEGTSSEPDFTLVNEDYAGIEAGARSQPALHDVDRDGDLDLFVGTRSEGVRFYRNAGTPQEPSFTAEALPFALDLAPSLADPAFADLDADGDADFVLAGEGGGLLLYRNQRITTSAAPPPRAERRSFELSPPRPNPFRARTTLTLRLAAPQHVTVTVHDALGRRVRTLRDGRMNAGTTRLSFEAKGWAAGTYFVRAASGEVVRMRAVVKVR